MSQRVVRVNELVKREISEILHTRYQQETVRFTVSQVSVSPDLRHGRVHYSVLGDDDDIRAAGRFFARHGAEIRRMVGKRIVLKYLPRLEFVHDQGLEHGARINRVLDELGLTGEPGPDEMPPDAS